MVVAHLLAGLFAVSLTATTVMFILAWYDHVNFRATPDDPAWREGASFLPTVKAVLFESAAMFVCLAAYPLHFYYDRRPRAARPDGGDPVLFVHGWGMGSHVFLVIRRLLRRMGRNNLYAVTWRPYLGNTRKLARQVADRIDEIAEQTGGRKVTLITHSMGGVLARYALKNLGAAGKVDKVVTLGGPHMGSRVAVLCPWGKNTLQMTYDSSFVKELAQGGLTPGGARYVSIWSGFDNAVLPPASSDLGEGAKNIVVPYHGHMSLLMSPKVLRLVKKEMQD
ncbi:MAG: alpha/beta fold hydrolase [Thermodesulfobacteriota bacterium]